MTDIRTQQSDNTEMTILTKRVRSVRKAPATAAPSTKAAQMTKLLTRARGATMEELGAATGWQPHSIRALLSGMRKTGVKLVRETRKSGDNAYRIVAARAATPNADG
ncbi:DUF3489 domain-containing protein [Polymorphobacter sp.]|uniref:DUF3489 domain-containing protein n=1 Tax=Polymorphobacter sp. TaxID=1909290 RepID=UPI003F6EC391